MLKSITWPPYATVASAAGALFRPDLRHAYEKFTVQKCVRIEAKGCGVHGVLLNKSAHESSGNSESRGVLGLLLHTPGSSEAHDRRDTVDATSCSEGAVALFRG